MSKKKRKSYSREFKLEAVGLITEKGYSIAEASRNLGIEYSVLRRWKNQLADDPQNAFPGKKSCAGSSASLNASKRNATS
jgi:transposase